MQYQVQYNDSPAKIARKFGTSVAALLAANPHKPTTIVAGYTTWRDLRPGETLSVPVGGYVGDAFSDAVRAVQAHVHAHGGSIPQEAVSEVLRGFRPHHGEHAVQHAMRELHAHARQHGGVVPTGAQQGIMDALRSITHRGFLFGLGDANSDANALAAVNPCDQANVALVCAFQGSAMGLTGLYRDGKYGSGVSAALRKYVPSAPPGCSPRPSWWAPAGQSNCVGVAPSAPPSAPPPSAPAVSGLTAAANAALAALNADPNYCVSVARPGTAVNTAIHNFKAAWNAANPSNPVPIGTGKYEPSVAAALSSALGGASVPPGCGAAVAPSAPPSAPPPAAPPPAAPPPAAAVPAAVQAVVAVNPCDQANVALVCAAQSAMRIGSDGKWGNDTSAAARRLVPSAPAGCSPRPAWWAPVGQSNCPGAAAVSQAATQAASTAQAAQAAQAATQAAQAAAAAAQTSGQTAQAQQAAQAAQTAAQAAQAAAAAQTPAQAAAAAQQAQAASAQAAQAAQAAGGAPAGGGVVAPVQKEGLSTGAIVAGAVGAVALVGIIAAASMAGKGKSPAGRRAARKVTRKPHRGTKRKPARKGHKTKKRR